MGMACGTLFDRTAASPESFAARRKRYFGEPSAAARETSGQKSARSIASAVACSDAGLEIASAGRATQRNAESSPPPPPPPPPPTQPQAASAAATIQALWRRTRLRNVGQTDAAEKADVEIRGTLWT
jgi:hypothetical protein